MMPTIELRWFALLRERFGVGGTQQLGAGMTVGDFWNEAKRDHPDLDALAVLFAVNEEYVEATYEPRDGDEVAIFPPVSGGA